MNPQEREDIIGSIEELDCLFGDIGQSLCDEELELVSGGVSAYPEQQDEADIWTSYI